MTADATRPSRRAIAACGVGLCATLAMTGCAPAPTPPARRTPFSDFSGWDTADHEAALAAYRRTASKARAASGLGVLADDWPRFPAGGNARRIFETEFTPVLVSDGSPALFTAYYEPVLRGSLKRNGPYQWPVYAKPPELGRGAFHTRAGIEAGAIANRGLELAWIDDPVEVFFLHIQGSGQVLLDDGRVLRLGYHAQNRRRYRAIGRILVERGEMTIEEVTGDSLRAWLRAQPDGGMGLMNENPSYVFFRPLDDLTPHEGPIGAMGEPVTAGVTAAVDPAHQPLGAPLWVEAEGVAGYEGRLMVAQDVGGAIKGAQRADLFIGSGEEAGRFAGAVRARGRFHTLIPKAVARRALGA